MTDTHCDALIKKEPVTECSDQLLEPESSLTTKEQNGM